MDYLLTLLFLVMTAICGALFVASLDDDFNFYSILFLAGTVGNGMGFITFIQKIVG